MGAVRERRTKAEKPLEWQSAVGINVTRHNLGLGHFYALEKRIALPSVP